MRHGLGFQGLQLAKLMQGEPPRVADIDEVKLNDSTIPNDKGAFGEFLNVANEQTWLSARWGSQVVLKYIAEAPLTALTR